MPCSPITGLIIAGGLARRMGGIDKGLQHWHARPLLAHVIERFAPQVGPLWLNVNHHAENHASFGLPMIADIFPGYAGPLAGLHAGLTLCTTPLLACTPCDTPLLPLDLVERLHTALETGHADIAVATAAGRSHPAFLLCRRDVLPNLENFLAQGGRRIGAWQDTANVTFVDFADEHAFANINTLEELNSLETP